MMAESIPGDHYTLVRNPRYYRASEGLPYLDKVVFRNVNQGHHPQGFAGRHHQFDRFLDVSQVQEATAPHPLYAHHFSHQ